MEEQIQVVVLPSPEILELLSDNQVDLVEILQQEGLKVDRAYGEDPTDPYSGHRDPVLIILASAGLIVSLTPIISRVLNSLSHRPIIVKERVKVPIEDSSGNIVYDQNGNPTFYWMDRTKLLEKAHEQVQNNHFTISGPGITIEYDDRAE